MSYFKDNILYPVLINCIDQAFPELNFTRDSGNGWISSKKLDGTETRKRGKTYVNPIYGYTIRENGGEAISFIDYEMRRSGVDYNEALLNLCKVCGIEAPGFDKEELENYSRNQKEKETILKQVTKALWDDNDNGARGVLEYMRSRGWTDEEIRNAELGYIDRSKLQLPSNYNKCIGNTHRLVIPFRSGSHILGFKFRNIEWRKGDKINKYINSTGLRISGLMGIGINVNDLVIVEGELDALHAQAKGANNIVATAGNGLSTAQLQDAKRKGVKKFTLLMDNDEAGRKFIEDSVKVMNREGVGSIYVAALPATAKDLDEYLKNHTLEDYNEIVRQALPLCLYQFNKLVEGYQEKCGSEEGLSLKERTDFYTETVNIINANTTDLLDRELIFWAVEQAAEGLMIDAKEFREWANSEYYRSQTYQRAEEVKKAINDISELMTAGRTEDAVKLMGKTYEENRLKADALELAKVFTPVPSSSFENYISEIKEGLPTGFKFDNGNIKEPFTLNSGLTFVCANRGHGKTSFLNNVAINVTKRNLNLKNGEKVLYFSYEVDKKRLLLDMLCAYIGKRLSENTARTILYYLQHTGEERFKYFDYNGNGYIDGETYRTYVDKKVSSFKRDLIESGSLTIVDESYKVEKLLEAIQFYISKNRVSLVCIDYAQLLYSESYSRARTEEIKRIVADIKDFANKTGIPFLFACQFNREVISPASVDTRNIGEGGDFERIADTCIGLFNLKELKSGTNEDDEAKKILSAIPNSGYKEGNLKKIDNKIFARLLKRRYGYFPIDTVFEWEGSCKYITPNDMESLEP